jgi:methionine sulfoxide reductase heme-binding subunit
MWATRWVAKPLVFIGCLLPAVYLAAGALGVLGVSLGADPVKYMLHACGLWTLRFLFITLCMTPLRDATHSVFWLRFRRMFGLFAFFYVVLHLIVYLVLDQAGKFGALWQDLLKRPYITVGMLGLLLLIPLAVTSTAKMQRRLGRRWIKLHRLIYVAAVLGVWHFWWGVKKDIREPLAYACMLAVLLGYRLYRQRQSLSRFSAAGLPRIDAA